MTGNALDDKRDLVRQGYNNCANTYSENRDLFSNNEYLEDLEKRLTPTSNILDLGCGSGIPIDKYFLDKGHRITGIDISEEQIKLARENLPSGSFFVGDMSAIDYPPNSFDAVVSFYAIFHIPREEHLALFAKLFALLKDGGYLLVTMGFSDWEGVEEDFHGVKMYWSHYDRATNIEMIKDAGFNIVYDMVDTSGGERHPVILGRKGVA